MPVDQESDAPDRLPRRAEIAARCYQQVQEQMFKAFGLAYLIGDDRESMRQFTVSAALELLTWELNERGED